MDSATIVAVVSIATAGITTGFGCMGHDRVHGNLHLCRLYDSHFC